MMTIDALVCRYNWSARVTTAHTPLGTVGCRGSSPQTVPDHCSLVLPADKIVSTLGEGTFGKVVKVRDLTKLVFCSTRRLNRDALKIFGN